MRLSSVTACLTLALSARPVRAERMLRTDFNNIYDEYADGVKLLLHDDEYCGKIYKRHQVLREAAIESGDIGDDSYKLRDDELTDVQKSFGVDSSSNLVVDCILNNSPELVKVRMASAQVLMGLTPSLLAILAPQAWQTGIIITVGRRPALALLLALGAPTLTPSLTSGSGLREALLRRSSQLGGSEVMLLPSWLTDVVRDGRVGQGVWRKLVCFVGWAGFYILAVASVANVAELMYRLITRSFLTFFGGSNWLLIMWAIIGIAIHVLGSIAVWLRIKRHSIRAGEDFDVTDQKPSSRQGKRRDNIAFPFARRKCQIEIAPPGLISMCLTWVTVIYSIAHVFYGTLLFSSLLFISVVDGVEIILRLLGSVVFCRIGMEYEIVMEMRDVEIVESRHGQNSKLPCSPPQLPPLQTGLAE